MKNTRSVFAWMGCGMLILPCIASAEEMIIPRDWNSVEKISGKAGIPSIPPTTFEPTNSPYPVRTLLN